MAMAFGEDVMTAEERPLECGHGAGYGGDGDVACGRGAPLRVGASIGKAGAAYVTRRGVEPVRGRDIRRVVAGTALDACGRPRAGWRGLFNTVIMAALRGDVDARVADVAWEILRGVDVTGVLDWRATQALDAMLATDLCTLLAKCSDPNVTDVAHWAAAHLQGLARGGR